MLIGAPRGQVLAEVASTHAERVAGLRGQAPLGPNAGLLLQWPHPVRPSIEMRGVDFSIDAIFVRGDGLVTEVARGLAANIPWSITSSFAVTFVLETAAGEADRLGIQPGVTLRFRGIP